MHELAICESVLRQALEVAASHGSSHVSRITLCIGPLAGVEPHLLLQAFPLAAAGTVCAGAAIEIKSAAVRVECAVCGAASAALANRLLCAACGNWRVALISGDEMRLDSIELRCSTCTRKGDHACVMFAAVRT